MDASPSSAFKIAWPDRLGLSSSKALGNALVIAALAVAAPGVAWFAHRYLNLTLEPAHALGWFWALAGAPWVEEFVFRRLLQRNVSAHFQSDQVSKSLSSVRLHAGAWGNGLTALMFAVVHAPAHGWYAVLWLVPALAIGEVWRRTNRLLPCVLLHAWFNACLAMASFFAA